MATTIVASAGIAPAFLQLGPGATDSYGAIDLRRMLLGPSVQEGVISSGAYKVTAGAGMTVSIAASTGDGALILGDNIASQGLYYVPPHTGAIVENVTAAHATLPRIDQVILENQDATYSGASNNARTRIVDGTATSGATLDNRNGVTALPSGAIRLADVLVPAAAVSISAGDIRDRRSWAKGALTKYLSTTDTLAAIPTGGAELTTSRKRVEATGNPLLVIARGIGAQTSSFSGRVGIMVGAVLHTAANGGGNPLAGSNGTAAVFNHAFLLEGLAAGSHLLSLAFYNGSGTGTFSVTATTNDPLSMIVREQVAPVADNT